MVVFGRAPLSPRRENTSSKQVIFAFMGSVWGALRICFLESLLLLKNLSEERLSDQRDLCILTRLSTTWACNYG